jgi:hypothetical protein
LFPDFKALITSSPEEILKNLKAAVAAHEKGPNDDSAPGDFSQKLQLVEQYIDCPDEDLGK